MREKKFRLKDFQNKIVGYEKWYEGVLHAKDGYWIAKPQWLYSIDNICWKPEYIEHRYKDQYIGLKDKNGKEIYERDKYQWQGYEVKDGKQIRPIRKGVIVWDFHELTRIQTIIESNGTLEIIGNIYENPELLEE